MSLSDLIPIILLSLASLSRCDMRNGSLADSGKSCRVRCFDFLSHAFRKHHRSHEL